MPTMNDVARRQRLFADDRVARLSRFRVDHEGDARTDPEGGRGDRLLPQQGGLEPRVAAARAPSASSCRRCRTRSTCPSSRARGASSSAHRADYVLQTIDYARGREPHAIALAPVAAGPGDPAALDRAHAGDREVAEDAADSADRGRQPAEAADPFRRRPFRFRCRLSGHQAADRDRSAAHSHHLRICRQHVERARPARRISPRDAEAGLAVPERLSRKSNTPSTPGWIASAGSSRAAQGSTASSSPARSGPRQCFSPFCAKAGGFPTTSRSSASARSSSGRYLPVPLTYVALPRRDTGMAAAELAVSLSSGEPIEHDIVKLPVKLMKYASA